MSLITHMFVKTTANSATTPSATTTKPTTNKKTPMTMTTINSYVTTTCATSKTTATTTIVTGAGSANASTRTTITSDPGILCFHHCNVKVFCFTLPHICPNCKTKLDTTGDEDGDEDNEDDENDNDNDNNVDVDVDIDGNDKQTISESERRSSNNGNSRVTITKTILPFRLPYPFVRASQYPCAIVLRPTTGDFLNDYNNAMDLHIAVTTSTGTVVEFDRHGLRQHRAENMPEWWQCLLVGDVPEPWYDYWDDILLQLCKQTARWSIAAYHEDTHNCYTFVLTFLQALSYEKLSEAAHSKTTFCEKYIVPRTTTAGKYISLYRKLRDTGGGIYVHPYASKRQQQQQSQRSKVRGYVKPPALIVPSSLSNANIVKKATKSSNSNSSSIKARSPTLCTIEE